MYMYTYYACAELHVANGNTSTVEAKTNCLQHCSKDGSSSETGVCIGDLVSCTAKMCTRRYSLDLFTIHNIIYSKHDNNIIDHAVYTYVFLLILYRIVDCGYS